MNQRDASLLPPHRGWAIASLVLGLLSLPTLGLLGLGAMLGIVFGVVALVKADRQPGTYGGRGLAISGIAASVLSFLMIPFIVGIIAAIAIPSLLRARIAGNDAATIADVRSLVSAEAAYRGASGGSFGTPECLTSPADCIPGYPATGPKFLASETIAETRHGYRRTFHPGPLAGAPAAASGLRSFAYTAIPLNWHQTGTRAFCADSKGQFCYVTEGEPEVTDGACPRACHALP